MSESTVLFVLCRVREGMRFGAQNQYGPGDVIELPVGVLTAFGDKLEQVMEAPAVEPEPDVAPEQVTKRQRRQQRDDVSTGGTFPGNGVVLPN